MAREPFFIPDLLNPAEPDPVLEAEREAHLAAWPDPRSYEAHKAWKEAHPDQKAPVRRTGRSPMEVLADWFGEEED